MVPLRHKPPVLFGGLAKFGSFMFESDSRSGPGARVCFFGNLTGLQVNRIMQGKHQRVVETVDDFGV